MLTYHDGLLPPPSAYTTFPGWSNSGQKTVDAQIRRRPWDDARDHGATLHLTTINMLMKPDQKGIDVACSSPDKPLVNGQIRTYAKVLIEVVRIQGGGRMNAPGRHVDQILLTGSGQPGMPTDVHLRGVRLLDAGEGCMPIHICDGNPSVGWGTVILEDVQAINCVHPIHIGGKTPVKLLKVIDCPGIRIVAGDKTFPQPPVEIINSPGAVVFGLGVAPPPGPVEPPAPPAPPFTSEVAEFTLNGRKFKIQEIPL